MVNASDYVAAGYQLLRHANLSPIPYVANGHTLAGMDCQGLAEFLLMQSGVPYSECNRAGSNSHIRECVWVGTPEECVEQFGSVPEGAWLFIVNADGGEPEKYRGDGVGNASHMGVYLSGSIAIHASASRGQVAESKFEGKTIPNGGWNMVGLCQWVDYGLDGSVADTEPVGSLTVTSANGKPVHLRKDPSTKNPYVDKIAVGSRVEVLGKTVVDGVNWSQVRVSGQVGFMQSAYLTDGAVGDSQDDIVLIPFDRALARRVIDAIMVGLDGQGGDG